MAEEKVWPRTQLGTSEVFLRCLVQALQLSCTKGEGRRHAVPLPAPPSGPRPLLRPLLTPVPSLGAPSAGLLNLAKGFLKLQCASGG